MAVKDVKKCAQNFVRVEVRFPHPHNLCSDREVKANRPTLGLMLNPTLTPTNKFQ